MGRRVLFTRRVLSTHKCAPQGPLAAKRRENTGRLMRYNWLGLDFRSERCRKCVRAGLREEDL